MVLQIGQLICLNGFATDAKEPGVERLVITKTRPDAGLSPEYELQASEIDAELRSFLNPHQLLSVKGWTRSFCFTTVLLLAYEHNELLEAWDDSCLDTYIVLMSPSQKPVYQISVASLQGFLR